MAKNLTELKQLLAAKLQQGCSDCVPLIRENTPIDTQRLFESIDSSNIQESGNIIQCKVTLGGKTLYGLRREQNKARPVNYAVYVEAKYGFVRQHLSEMKTIIMESLTN